MDAVGLLRNPTILHVEATVHTDLTFLQVANLQAIGLVFLQLPVEGWGLMRVCDLGNPHLVHDGHPLLNEVLHLLAVVDDHKAGNAGARELLPVGTRYIIAPEATGATVTFWVGGALPLGHLQVILRVNQRCQVLGDEGVVVNHDQRPVIIYGTQ